MQSFRSAVSFWKLYQPQIQSVEESLKEIRADVKKRLVQQINNDINNVKAEVDKQLGLNRNEITHLSGKVNDIIHGQEGEWTQVVKKQVTNALKTVADNINEVQNNLE